MNKGAWASFKEVKLHGLKQGALKPFWPLKNFKILETTDQTLKPELRDFIRDKHVKRVDTTNNGNICQH